MRKIYFRIDRVLGFVGFRYDCMVDDSGFYHFDRDFFGRVARLNVEYGVVNHVFQIKPDTSNIQIITQISEHIKMFYGSNDFELFEKTK